jgi:O-antigen/teichoic acid export membrane protein
VSLYPIIAKGHHDHQKLADLKISWRDISSFLTLTLAVALLLAVFTHTDILLTKYFFSSGQAGQYAALSVTAKMIIYSSGILTAVMFPRLSASQAADKSTGDRVLGSALAILFLVSFPILLMFFLAPKTVLNIIFGAKYLEVAPLVGLLGLAMFLGAVATMIIYYFVVLNYSRVLIPLVIIVMAQLILISFFHSSLQEVVYLLLITNAVMLTLISAMYCFVKLKG